MCIHTHTHPHRHANKKFYQTYVLLLDVKTSTPSTPCGTGAFPGLAARHARISNDGVEVLKTATSKRYGMWYKWGTHAVGRGRKWGSLQLTLFYGWSVLEIALVSDYASCGHKFILKDVRC